MRISYGQLKLLDSVESLEPTVDCSLTGTVPLAKFGLCDTVLVRNSREKSLHRFLFPDAVKWGCEVLQRRSRRNSLHTAIVFGQKVLTNSIALGALYLI